ncbi:MAG: hypothetical protein R3285_09375, partial [Kiloniellales bacterium]|nr:hypothetical protein [Kiloniellales bacterium]
MSRRVQLLGPICLVLSFAWAFPATAQDDPSELDRALLGAAFSGDEDLALYALERGADTAARAPDGLTALHLASALGHEDVAAL